MLKKLRQHQRASIPFRFYLYVIQILSVMNFDAIFTIKRLVYEEAVNFSVHLSLSDFRQPLTPAVPQSLNWIHLCHCKQESSYSKAAIFIPYLESKRNEPGFIRVRYYRVRFLVTQRTVSTVRKKLVCRFI